METVDVGEILFSAFDEKSGFDILFVAAAIIGDPIAREHDDIAWCSLAELSNYHLAPSDQMFAAFLQEGLND